MMKPAALISMLALCLPLALAAADGDVYTFDTLKITVARTSLAAGEMTAAISVLDREQVTGSPGVLLDEILSSQPAFSLYRRSGSLVAHPTAQGISLRGIGATSTSRTLVLLDGMPLNDPFGGWISWSRINAESVRRVEIIRGGSGYLWGNYAMGGVINLITGPPEGHAVSLSSWGGSLGSYGAQLSSGATMGRNSFSLEGGWSATGGHPVVRKDQRGAIDTDADSRAWNVAARFSRPLTENTDIALRGGFFGEERSNGTPLTGNATNGGWGMAELKSGGFRLSSFLQHQKFHSTFSSQAAGRASETLSLDQFDVPGTAWGTAAEWSSQIFNSHALSTGADFRIHAGETNERYFYSGGRLTRVREAGGNQQLAGAYIHDTWSATRNLNLDFGLRLDRWRQSGGFRREAALDTAQVFRDYSYAARDSWVLEPGAGLVYRPGGNLALRTSVYRTFRAPTLNELYRPFRVRNDITEANPSLDPEKLSGAEAGFDLAGQSARFSATAYWNRISGAIANVTIGHGPGQFEPGVFVPEGGSYARRQNLGRVRAMGLELELELRLHRTLSLETSWLYSSSTVRSAPGHPELSGKRLAQVPRQTLVAGLRFSAPLPITGVLQLRDGGRQYEDDLNAYPLAGYATLDIYLERALSGSSGVFMRGQNLLDRSYPVGVTADGLVSIGSPRRVNAGFRTGF